MSFKRTAFRLLACLLVMSMAGCKQVENEPVSSLPVSSAPVSSEPVSSEPAEPQNLNPLTGEADLSDAMIGKRPVSFIINNSHNAWPHMGISQADLVYEWPYEGSQTRIMSIYSDYTKVGTVGGLRSARHDFVELSLPFHTLFVHWGGSYAGYEWLDIYDVDHLDGNKSTGCFYRDEDRLNSGYSLEHTAMLATSGLPKAIEENQIDMNWDTPDAYQFNKEATPIAFSDTAANEISVQIASGVKCIFRYDAATAQYSKWEFGEQDIDGSNNAPVMLDNVFVLYANITGYGDDPVLRDLHLEDGGTGYYITRGTKTAVNWSKPSPNDRIRYTLPSGEELTVNTGNSWVVFTYNDETNNTTFS